MWGGVSDAVHTDSQGPIRGPSLGVSRERLGTRREARKNLLCGAGGQQESGCDHEMGTNPAPCPSPPLLLSRPQLLESGHQILPAPGAGGDPQM